MAASLLINTDSKSLRGTWPVTMAARSTPVVNMGLEEIQKQAKAS